MIFRLSQRMLTLNIMQPQIFYFTKEKTSTLKLQPQFTEIMSEQKQKVTSGRAWRSEELRIKSNQDLHKLWFVCVKEKNLLLADQVIEKKISENSSLGPRKDRIKLTMSRILGVIKEREIIRKQYREQLHNEYVAKKKQELQARVEERNKDKLPEITSEMLRAKYHELRKGVDNVKYLQRIFEKQQTAKERKERMQERLKNLQKDHKLTSFWEYEMGIGERPLQQQILRTQIKNWKKLNLKQRKIILGFLNARRARDAKDTFISQLKILGSKIAFDSMSQRIASANKTQ